MSDWTSGYVADIGYTYGYYNELNPQKARLALLNAGYACPEFENACELGFGQGVSINIHAAASKTHWFGTDFNPSQAAFAQGMAAASGTKVGLFDQSFAEFAARDDLPEFDYIGLHGIWSWISDENRNIIVDFIRRKLKVGGVLFMSYNAMPGWSVFAPMRHLWTEHARVMGSEGQGILKRIEAAIDFGDQLLAGNPNYAKANPQLKPRLDKAKSLNKSYLAHEYFNRDWHPMYFSDVAEYMHKAKLEFACSVHLTDHVDVLNLTGEQSKFLQDLPDKEFRETVRDYMTNQQFRRDLWVKGPIKLNKAERAAENAKLSLILVTHADDVSMKINGLLGELTLKEEVYKPVVRVMSDHKPRTLNQIAEQVKDHGITVQQLSEVIPVLAGAGHLVLVQDAAVMQQSLDATARLNHYLLEKARSSNEVSFLASPVTGGGIAVTRFQQLFMIALNKGSRSPESWAKAAWETLKSQGQKIQHEGVVLQTDEENLGRLLQFAAEFEKKGLPILAALKIL
jgi:hypothetical protein